MEPLESREVHHNLDWQWSWRGLAPKHLLFVALFCLLPLAVSAIFCIDLPFLTYPVLSVIGAGFIGALQYRRDPDYLERTVTSLFEARHLSAFIPEQRRPFPVSRQELECPPK